MKLFIFDGLREERGMLNAILASVITKNFVFSFYISSVCRFMLLCMVLLKSLYRESRELWQYSFNLFVSQHRFKM